LTYKALDFTIDLVSLSRWSYCRSVIDINMVLLSRWEFYWDGLVIDVVY